MAFACVRHKVNYYIAFNVALATRLLYPNISIRNDIVIGVQ